MFREIVASGLFAVALSFASADAATTVNTGGSVIGFQTYVDTYQLFEKNNRAIFFNYEAAGSAAGKKAFLTDDIKLFQGLPKALVYGTIVGDAVHVGATDNALTGGDLTNAATGSYPGSATWGPIIQIPTLRIAVTIPFNQAGVGKANLVLDDNDLCGVLSSKITDWRDLVPTIAAGTTINVVVRSDSDLTSFLLTQHLSAVCNAGNSNFPALPVPITYTFPTVFNNRLPANFIAVNGAAAEAAALLKTANSLGYLTPDYTSIAPKAKNTTNLRVASLVNTTDGKAYQPTLSATYLALVNPGIGASNANPPNSLVNAMNPLNWAPTLPAPSKGYPLLGFTYFYLSSCYQDKTVGAAIVKFLTAFYNNANYLPLKANNGFGTTTPAYATAITNIFLNNKRAYNLNIDNATICANYRGR